MAKSQANKKRASNQKKYDGGKYKGKAGRLPPSIRASLDAAAVAHARLLVDPCGANLAQPVYTGYGSGQLIRTKAWVTPMVGANTDLQMTFFPSYGAYIIGQALTGAGGTMGGALFPFVLTTQRFRCVAACAKLVYTGSESARSGIVGLSSGLAMFYPGQVSVASPDYLSQSGMISRLGEVVHEVRWIPSEEDEGWHMTTDFAAVGVSYVRDTSAVNVVVSGAPPLSLAIELTAVYEVMGGGAQSYSNAVAAPPSRNTLAEVLRALGPPIKWAFSHVAAPVVKSIAGVAVSTVESTVRAAATNGPGMLALTAL